MAYVKLVQGGRGGVGSKGSSSRMQCIAPAVGVKLEKCFKGLSNGLRQEGEALWFEVALCSFCGGSFRREGSCLGSGVLVGAQSRSGLY